jgi:hypothetical protein
VAQQAIGRGRSRTTLNGKAGRQDTILFFTEDQDFNITARLKAVYPGVTWMEYQPVFAKESQPTLIEVWSEKVLRHWDSLPMEVEEQKSRRLKKTVGAVRWLLEHGPRL